MIGDRLRPVVSSIILASLLLEFSPLGVGSVLALAVLKSADFVKVN